jgi:DNA-binding response OmpR family regulator
MLPEREEIATVVVCEDDEPTLELLCDHLIADRFGALAAPSASDALRLCRYKQPDLLLLDLLLPDASGLDVLRQIRESDGVASRFDPLLPVIVLTGRGADADRVRGFEIGADDYVVNPSSSLSSAMPLRFSTGRKASSSPSKRSGRGIGTTLQSPASNGSLPASLSISRAASRTAAAASISPGSRSSAATGSGASVRAT